MPDPDFLPTVPSDTWNVIAAEAPDLPELTLEQRIDFAVMRLNELHVKVDNLTQGLQATYSGVHNLVTMLSAVQQVASMMPGGKRLAQAMMNAQNGSPSNG
jgi:hypothetical protein